MIPADIQDRDCAANLIRKTRCLFPWIPKLFADGGYAGAKLKAALAGQPVELEIVKRTDNEGGFKVVRRRWVVKMPKCDFCCCVRLLHASLTAKSRGRD